jgi:aldehyde dehydrogenase (NAD+)
VGDPTAEGTKIEPMANSNQYKRVRDHIDAAVTDGAYAVVGGSERREGFYVRPTVLANARPASRTDQEEIFGPVLAAVPYHSEDEAPDIAHRERDAVRALRRRVLRHQNRAVQFPRRMRTGMVDSNGGRFNRLAPSGAYKQSGDGRELGSTGWRSSSRSSGCSSSAV